MNQKNNFTINHTQYNQEKTCLFCSTSQGLIIYSINPFRQLIKKYIPGGLSFGTIYNRSNIFFMVGTGIHSEYPTNRLIVWDEKFKKKIAEISIKNKIEGFSINNNSILLYCKKNLYIYDILSLHKQHEIQIVSYAFSSNLNKKKYLLCYPQIEYKDLGKITIKTNTTNIKIHSHNDPVQKVCISNDGKLIATCSNKGHLIKLFDNKGLLIREYNRGFRPQRISYLGFSNQSKWLICATEYSSIHIFDLSQEYMPTSYLRERSRFIYKINEIIIDCYMEDSNNSIIFNSLNKIYTGYFTEHKIIINHNYLLIIDKDPFSLSPKYLKKIGKK